MGDDGVKLCIWLFIGSMIYLFFHLKKKEADLNKKEFIEIIQELKGCRPGQREEFAEKYCVSGRPDAADIRWEIDRAVRLNTDEVKMLGNELREVIGAYPSKEMLEFAMYARRGILPDPSRMTKTDCSNPFHFTHEFYIWLDFKPSERSEMKKKFLLWFEDEIHKNSDLPWSDRLLCRKVVVGSPYLIANEPRQEANPDPKYRHSIICSVNFAENIQGCMCYYLPMVTYLPREWIDGSTYPYNERSERYKELMQQKLESKESENKKE